MSLSQIVNPYYHRPMKFTGPDPKTEHENEVLTFIRNEAIYLAVYGQNNVRNIYDVSRRIKTVEPSLPTTAQVQAVEKACQKESEWLNEYESLAVREYILRNSENIYEKSGALVGIFTSGFLKRYKDYMGISQPEFNEALDEEKREITQYSEVVKHEVEPRVISFTEAQNLAFNSRKETREQYLTYKKRVLGKIRI